MASVNGMAQDVSGNPKANASSNAPYRPARRWEKNGDDSQWWRGIPSRTEEGQKNIAKMFHTFVRAYLVALESNAAVPGVDGVGSKKALDKLKAAENLDAGGKLKMGAVIRSFSDCPGDVMYHTLCLLNWAGHAASYSTVNAYNYAVTSAVTVYWAARNAREMLEDAEVCIQKILDLLHEPVMPC